MIQNTFDGAPDLGIRRVPLHHHQLLFTSDDTRLIGWPGPFANIYFTNLQVRHLGRYRAEHLARNNDTLAIEVDGLKDPHLSIFVGEEFARRRFKECRHAFHQEPDSPSLPIAL
jgi:hypothetical protein